MNKKGFSLIELMVVVAIIGILSAIAIPNFQKFQRKARQSEAKSNLAGIYTAEKAFYAEWNQYFSDLDIIGFVPDGNLLYNTGFSTASTPALPGNYTGPAATGSMDTATLCGSGAAGVNCVDISGGEALPGATADPAGIGNGATFVAGAAGNIGGDNIDHWTMDNGKQLVNQQDGIQ